MARVTRTISLSVPPKLMVKIDQLTKEESRTRSELFREALRRYIEEQEWKKIFEYGRLKAKSLGITKDQVEDIVDAYRQ